MADAAKVREEMYGPPAEPERSTMDALWAAAKGTYRGGGAALNKAQGYIGDAEEFLMDTINPLSMVTRPLTDKLTQAAVEKSGVPEMLAGWEEASPDSFENAKAGMGWASLLPGIHAARKIMPKAINAGTDNLATRLDGSDLQGNNPNKSGGFYGGDPIGGILQGYNFKEHMKQLYDPQSIANKERRGFGQHRMDELEATQGGHNIGNARASAYMHTAKNKGKKTGALIEDLPAANANSLGVVRANDKEGLTALLTSEIPEGHNLPEHVRSRFIDRDVARLGERKGLKEKGIAHLFQGGRIPDADRAIVNVNDPRATYSELATEAAGDGLMGSAVGKSLVNKNVLKSADGAFGKPTANWDKDEWLQYYNTNAMFEKNNWVGTQTGHDKLIKQPWFKKLSPSWQEKALKASGMNDPKPGLKDLLTKEGSKTTPSPAVAMQQYWNAKKTQKAFDSGESKRKLKPAQQKLIDAVETLKKQQGDNAVYTKAADGTEYIDYVTSWNSKDQALGGVGGRYSHDLTNNNIYSNGIDGHDMMGADPVNGDQLWNMTPITVYQPGKPPDLTKRSQATDPKWQQAMRDFEEKSGVPRLAKESDEAYQKRALGLDAAVKARHYAAPIKDAAVVGGMLSGFGASNDDPNRTAGGLPVGLMNPNEQEKQAYLRTLKKPVVGNISQKDSKNFYS